MIRAIISDFDGTLCNTKQAISVVLQETFRARGKDVPSLETIHASIGRGITLEETLAELVPALASTPDVCREWVVAYREIYDGGLGIRSSTEFPGTRAALTDLSRAGIPIIVVSNKGTIAVERTLRHLALEPYVHAVVGAEMGMATKPDPKSFSERIAPFFPDLKASDYLMVGDTPTDIRYARAIGAPSAWVSFGYGDQETCRALNPDYVFDDLAELAELFAA